MVARQRVLAADRLNQRSVTECGKTWPQRLAHRALACDLRSKERDLHAPFIVRGKSVELNAIAEIPDVNRKTIRVKWRRTTRRLEPMQLLRLHLEIEPGDFEYLRRPRSRRED